MDFFALSNKPLNIITSSMLTASGYGPGVREAYILHYVTSGSGYFESCGIRHKITVGQSFLIHPDTVVEYYPDKNDPWTYIWVDFDGEMAKELLSLCAFTRYEPIAPKFVDDELYNIYRALFECFNSEIYAENIKSYAAMYRLFSFYVEHFPTERNLGSDYGIEPMLKYISHNIHKPELTVEAIAEAFGLERTTLYRRFIRHTRLSPAEYIKRQRISKAKRMLKKTDMSVKEISVSVGFENQMYFSRVFKESVGCAPLEYRRSEMQKKHT